jgi:Mismatch repair ATPase (MutS family)
MGLLIDKQTRDDLSIFAARGTESIFGLYNKTATSGGAELLEEWFNYPLSDAAAIGRRTATIQYFMQQAMLFPFQSSWFDQALFYLDMADERSRLQAGNLSLKERFQQFVGGDTDYKKVVAGIIACSKIMHCWKELIHSSVGSDDSYREELKKWSLKFENSGLDQVPLLREKEPLKREAVIRYDNILRFEEKDLLLNILRDIYTFDVYLSVAQVANERHFVLPLVDSSTDQRLIYEGVFHPLVRNAKGNDHHMDSLHNITFLTGANMAGKSTFMKSLGIALYLAHVGFPVPAKRFVFSPRDGIFTSINLPDNIAMGYSHFFAEVLRIKKVAQQLAEGRKLFVIFDEMFRGTNVKDAFEGTVEVVSRLYHHPRCQFVLSTHILEAGEQLMQGYPDIKFVFLPTTMVQGKPSYSYKLQQGISADRHGMIIIENEGIIDLLTSQKQTGA